MKIGDFFYYAKNWLGRFWNTTAGKMLTSAAVGYLIGRLT